MTLVVLQAAAIAVLLCLSAFYSGSETGFYRMSRFRLRLGMEQQRPFVHTLFGLIKEGRSLVMSLLIGNNLVNYLLTSLITTLLFQRLSDQHLAEIYTTLIVTPTLFVFGEMIPKVLFYHRADAWMPPLTWLLWSSYKAFTLTGAVAMLRWFSDLLTRLLGLEGNTAVAVDATQRHQVFQIIHETREEGLLSEVQREMIERLLQIPNVSVNTIMTPFSRVKTIDLNTSRRQLLECLPGTSYVRWPVCRDNGTVAGYILIYDVLGGETDFAGLGEFVRPLITLPPTCSAIEAMNTLCRQREKIALIQSPQSKQPLGIITLTDLVEELTGELSAR